MPSAVRVFLPLTINSILGVGNLIKHRRIRPTTCGDPKYTNKKICKRAGIKCLKSDIPEDQPKLCEIKLVDTIVFESEDLLEDSSNPLGDDYQEVSVEEPTILEQSEDFEKKEMDVFDYIGIEIKNIEEQEQREKQQDNEEPSFDEVEEFLIEEVEEIVVEKADESDDFILDETDVDFTIEKVPGYTFDFEFNNYVDFLDGSTYQCKLCPKRYLKKHITVKHLKTE